MKFISCPECGETVPLLAGACSHCGAPNMARRNVAIVGATLAILVVIVIAAVLLAIRPSGPPDAGKTVPEATPKTATKTATETATETKEDFGWLTAAMKSCDEDASKDIGTLHFMVIPLVDQAKDEPGWRRISLNDIGNAILIKAEDMLAGLQRGALRISTADYVFAVRNEATKVIYKWSPSAGVKRFSSPNAEDIETFKVQFQAGDGTASPSWGATFVRRRGNCYWVNAIVLPPQR